tara:strand:+ start:11 stop:214 length:204 start_codon:yes stop_codon:yes gene_type:complete
MIDYSESLIKIKHLRKKAHDAILDRRWSDACDHLDDIVVAAREAKMFCLGEIKDDKNIPFNFLSGRE